jgi:hypothetical protein
MCDRRWAVNLSVFVLAILGACSAGAPSDHHFRTKLAVVERDVVDLTSIFDLLHSRMFCEVFRHPTAYRQEILDILEAKDATETQKLIAALAAQTEPPDELRVFWRHVLALRRQNRISERVFQYAAFPDFDWSVTLPCSHSTKEVGEILGEMRQLDVSRDLKDLITQSQSGQMCTEIKRRRRQGILNSESVVESLQKNTGTCIGKD